MAKVALITGVTGQDGAYLAELLLDKGYIVHGLRRRSSSFNTGRIEHLYQDPHESGARLFLHYGDLTDATNLIRIVQETQPDEIYNLAAQSHVQVSFETPEYTANADALGTLRLLEAIRILGLEREDPLLPGLDLRAVRQGAAEVAADARPRRSIRAAPTASPSSTPIGSRSIIARPTACTPPTASCSITRARLRGETFVTRKITRAVAAIKLGLAGQALSRQPRRQARLGPCPRLRRGHVADAAAGAARRLRARDRRDAQSCASSSRRRSPRSAVRSTGSGAGVEREGHRRPAPARCWSRSIRATSGRPRSTC